MTTVDHTITATAAGGKNGITLNEMARFVQDALRAGAAGTEKVAMRSGKRWFVRRVWLTISRDSPASVEPPEPAR